MKCQNRRIEGDNIPPGLFLKGKIPESPAVMMFFVDGVYATGATFNAANRMFDGKLKLLVYARDTGIRHGERR